MSPSFFFLLFFPLFFQSPGEIKRREVSWTLTKKVQHFCGSRWDQEEGGGVGPSGKPKRDLEQGGGAGLWKLDFFCFSCYSTAALRTLSLWLCPARQLKQQLRSSTLVATQWRGDTALTLPLFWRRSTAYLVFRVGARSRAGASSLDTRTGHSSKSVTLWTPLQLWQWLEGGCHKAVFGVWTKHSFTSAHVLKLFPHINPHWVQIRVFRSFFSFFFFFFFFFFPFPPSQ